MYNLLIADDEEMIRNLIRKYAEFEGHKVTAVSYTHLDVYKRQD